MFLYTQAALNKIVTDLKRINFIYNLLSPIITIAYLIYACFAGTGIIYVNITLAALTAVGLTLYLSLRKNKKLLRKSRHVINRLKILTKAFSLGVAIYGIYLANEKTTVFTIVFAAINILTWMLQLAIEVLTTYAEAQIELIKEGFKADFEEIKEGFAKPINAAKDLFKKISGKESDDEEAEEAPNRNRRFLEKRVEKLIEAKRRKKEEKKLKKQQEKVD